MDFLKEHKNIMIGIGVVVVLFIGYSFFKSDAADTTGPALISTSAGGNDFVAGRDIVALLVDLQAIKIQSDFFSDPALRSLQDFSIPLVDEPRGRANPFAPIGVDSVSVVPVGGTGAGQ